MKVLYVRNLTTSVSEEKIRETFESHGRVERVKKIKGRRRIIHIGRPQMLVGGGSLKRDIISKLNPVVTGWVKFGLLLRSFGLYSSQNYGRKGGNVR